LVGKSIGNVHMEDQELEKITLIWIIRR